MEAALNHPDISLQLGEDLYALVNTIDAPLCKVVSLSGVGYPGYEPRTYYLECRDGRIFKGRRFETELRAQKVEYISRHLDHRGFPEILASFGKAHLTEWIEGQTFNSAEVTLEDLGACGVLQGFMHNITVPRKCPYQPRETIHDLHDGLKSNLTDLVTAGLLNSNESEQIIELAQHHLPEEFSLGFVHRDLCAENIVLRSTGGVCVIDDETLGVDAYDYDLARTWYRWPMTPAQRKAYFDGYCRYRSVDEFLAHFPFWATLSIVGSAVYRLQRKTNAARMPVNKLRVLFRDLQHGITVENAVFRS